MEPQISARELEIILNELDKIMNSTILGDVVEFGCFEGATSIHLAKKLEKSARKLYVYDSFEGLPEKSYLDKSVLGESFKTGELNVSKKQFIRNLERARAPMPIIVKGWFNELNETHVPAKICFAFLDGDYYDSICDSFKLISKKLQPGAMVVFHDYSNPALPGVKRAVDEITEKHGYQITQRETLAIIKI
jgi:O-methyltransferase